MMTSKPIKVFVPLLRKQNASFGLRRAKRYVDSLVIASGSTIIDELSAKTDIAHFLSARIALDYESALEEYKIPYVINAFNDAEDFQMDPELIFTLKKETIRIYNSAATVIVFFLSQKLLLRHLGITSPIEIIGPIGINAREVHPVELSAFFRTNAINEDQKYIINYGVYNPTNGFDEYESLARIMPDLEFYFYGIKNPLFSSSTHYSSSSSLSNLHYEYSVEAISYFSMIANATALVLTGKFHIDCLVIADFMYNEIPIVSNKNPVLYDLLIKGKTANISVDIDEFYQSIHDIKTINYIFEAAKYIKQFSVESESPKLKSIYLSIIK